MKDALANIERMEDTFFDAVAKASKTAGPLQGPWEHVLAVMKMKGSDTGAQAAQTVESLLAQAQTGMRSSRASGMRAAQAMLDSYSALVSGVLIGMSEGLQSGKAGKAAAGRRPSPAAASAPAAKRAAPRRRKAAPA